MTRPGLNLNNHKSVNQSIQGGLLNQFVGTPKIIFTPTSQGALKISDSFKMVSEKINTTNKYEAGAEK